MSLIASYLLPAAGNQVSQENWWVALDNTNSNYRFKLEKVRIILDSNGNPFSIGTIVNQTGVGRDVVFIAKLNDNNGGVKEDKEIGVSNFHVTFQDAIFDSNDNLFIVFWYGTTSSVLAKINSNLSSVAWSRQNYITNQDVMWERVAVDSNDDFYLAGLVADSGSNDEAVGSIKINGSDGLTSYKRTFRQDDDRNFTKGICIHDNNGTDEVFVAFFDTNRTNDSFILEYNTSGVLQNQYRYDFRAFDNKEDMEFGHIVSDGTNLFVGVAADSEGGIVKINPTNGNVLDYVMYSLVRGNDTDFLPIPAVTPDGNYVYLLGNFGATLELEKGWLAKFDTSTLSLQWQRSININDSDQRADFKGITATNDHVYISILTTAQGTSSEAGLVVNAKLPGDGTGTDTYGSGDTITIIYSTANSAVAYELNDGDSTIQKRITTFTDSTSNVVNGSRSVYYQDSGLEVEQTNRF